MDDKAVTITHQFPVVLNVDSPSREKEYSRLYALRTMRVKAQKDKGSKLSQSNCCYEYGQDGDEAMFGTPWKRQPCRELGENHAGFNSLNEKANDTRTENAGLTLRSRGDP